MTTRCAVQQPISDTHNYFLRYSNHHKIAPVNCTGKEFKPYKLAHPLIICLMLPFIFRVVSHNFGNSQLACQETIDDGTQEKITNIDGHDLNPELFN